MSPFGISGNEKLGWLQRDLGSYYKKNVHLFLRVVQGLRFSVLNLSALQIIWYISQRVFYCNVIERFIWTTYWSNFSFFKNFFVDTFPLLGPLISLFQTSGDVLTSPLGFIARVGSLTQTWERHTWYMCSLRFTSGVSARLEWETSCLSVRRANHLARVNSLLILFTIIKFENRCFPFCIASP